MRASLLLSVFVLGCVPAPAVLVEPDATPGGDTGLDLGGDADPGTGGDPDTEADTDPDTVPAPLRWSGSRAFSFSSDFGECEDTLTEVGEEITDDPAWADARWTCPGCEHVFLIETDKDRLCAQMGFPGFPVATPIVRGVDFVGGGEFVFWVIQPEDGGGWSRYELATGQRSGNRLTYDYDGEIWGSDYQVEGEAILQ